MNQVYSGNYQSYQPSYQAPCMGQWTAQSYNQGPYSYYNNGPSQSYGRKTYSTPCMGQCNPPKLYADTFNYLTENLMKPVIQEVYQDLKSITAANTVGNSPAASNLGLQAQGQSKVMSDAEPLSSGLIKGQLHDISAVSPASHTQNGLMAPKSLPTQLGTLYQTNIPVSRNGLNQA